MLTTLQSRISVSYKFTDPTLKPSFRGRRFRFLVSPPERSDLWEEYVALRSVDIVKNTSYADEFYAKNFDAMNAGAEVSNPNRFVPPERTALQFYYNEVARLEPAGVATEYDNDPPEESGPVESGITPHRIQTQLSGHERKRIPPGCIVLTQGIDVRKVALHWVVRAWREDGTGFTIDYGVSEVHGTIYGSDEGLDVSITKAILARMEESKATKYAFAEGATKPIDLTLIDAGWRTDAVYAACATAGLGVMPIMGAGRSSGCAVPNFHDLQKVSVDRKPGDGWFLTRKFKGRLWLVYADTDRWKAWEHDRWMTVPDKPGAMFLFGTPGIPGGRLNADEQAHHSYARHICNETEIEEPHKGTVRRRWRSKSENTHWLDASYYANVAANIKGIRIATSAAAVAGAAAGGKKTLSLQEMAKQARK